MKASRFADRQIIAVLKAAEADTLVPALFRTHEGVGGRTSAVEKMYAEAQLSTDEVDPISWTPDAL